MKKLFLRGLAVILVCVMIPSAIFAGPAAKEILRPTAEGTYTEIRYVRGGGDHYADVDEALADDWTTYVSTDSDTWEVDTYAIADPSSGSGLINDVTVYVRSTYNVAGDGGLIKAAVYTHGALYYGDEEIPEENVWKTYAKKWTTNPVTGLAWTWSEISDLEAGVALRRIGGTWTYCTQVYIEVSYTTSGPVVPTSETDIDTSVIVNGGNGSSPLIKCKWETPDDADPSHATSFTQVLPSGEYQVDKPMKYYAVVTDPEGAGTVSSVYADVFHPCGPPECGSFKYQLELKLVPKEESGPPYPEGSLTPIPVADLKALVQQAYDDGLIKFGPNPDDPGNDFTIDEVIHEIGQCLADVYCGEQVMSYHQPTGDYRVEAYAFDKNNNMSDVLVNYFWYAPLTKVEFDFVNVNYGSVEVCTNKWVGGDTTFSPGDGLPTVRNLGNTNAQIVVAQDDMGLGHTSGVPNVEYDARLGPIGGNPHVTYDPAVYQPDELSASNLVNVIPGILELCNTQKLDFSVHVKKAPADTYNGEMLIGAIWANWTGSCDNHR